MSPETNSNGDRFIPHPVQSYCFQNVQRDTARQVKCVVEPKVHRDEKESNSPRNAVSIAKFYSNNIASMIKCGAILMYPVHAFVLNFIMELQWMLSYSPKTLLVSWLLSTRTVQKL